ncbi:MAG: hypothetical protein MJE66_10495 [Proteobacteria bacterium]|nr:hypothetical protein [Pseudomonadota bacterium]
MWDERRTRRFGGADHDPTHVLANLVDVMLVFACGLIVALAMSGVDLQGAGHPEVEAGREIPDLPVGMQGGAGAGFEPVGRVFRDPATGKLILVGSPPNPKADTHKENGR